MRTTQQIDDPKWTDIEDRDALIRRIAATVRQQLFNNDGRPDVVLIDDILEDALESIGDGITGSIQGVPSDAELEAMVNAAVPPLVDNRQRGMSPFCSVGEQVRAAEEAGLVDSDLIPDGMPEPARSAGKAVAE